MATRNKLSFSNFPPQEFQSLCQLLCSEFNTSATELAQLYQDITSTFEQPGWPTKCVRREFFESTDEAFQSTYQKSPIVAVDLPSLMELDKGQVNKPTIAIIGQDPKNTNKCKHLIIGTPFGLHHKDSREKLLRTKLYFEMIQVLLQLGYRVYLTDLLKIWVSDLNQCHIGMKLPTSDHQRFLQLLQRELELMQPVAAITWGKKVGNVFNQAQLGIRHINFPHPSSAANGAWKMLIDKPPTYTNKLVYWQSAIAEKLKK